jgi:hypothetical protein
MKSIILSSLFLILSFLISFTSTSQTLPSYLPTNGLVGWWPFNGNANDESGNDGTLNGAVPAADRDGSSTSAFSFNGMSRPKIGLQFL